MQKHLFDASPQWLFDGKRRLKKLFAVKKRVRIKKTLRINEKFVQFLKDNYPDLYHSIGLEDAIKHIVTRHGVVKENISSSSAFDFTHLPSNHTLHGLYKKLFAYTREDVLSSPEWQLSLDFLKVHFKKSLFGNRPLTYDQTISILKKSFSKTSSTGYLWKREGYDIKLDFWDRFRPIYDEVEASLAKGESPLLFWTMFWKDEMRETSRALDGNSRAVWSCSPIQLFYSVMYFHELFEKFLGNREFTWSFCGSDFNSSDFDFRLSAFKGKFCFALDYSPFDASQTAHDLADQFDLFRDSLLPEYQVGDHLRRILMVLNNEIFSSVVMPDGNVVQVSSGNPTGSWFTMLRNIFQNFRYLAYVWIKERISRNESPSYLAFCKEVALLNGDDSVVVCSKYLNPRTVKKHLSHLETTGCLSQSGLEFGYIQEMSFCNCRPFWFGDKLIPLRDPVKLLLSFCFKIFDNYSKMEGSGSLDSCRAIGYAMANPWDSHFQQIIQHYCVYCDYPYPNVDKIRSRYFV